MNASRLPISASLAALATAAVLSIAGAQAAGVSYSDL